MIEPMEPQKLLYHLLNGLCGVSVKAKCSCKGYWALRLRSMALSVAELILGWELDTLDLVTFCKGTNGTSYNTDYMDPCAKIHDDILGALVCHTQKCWQMNFPYKAKVIFQIQFIIITCYSVALTQKKPPQNVDRKQIRFFKPMISEHNLHFPWVVFLPTAALTEL